jgi:hypothetical protein
MLVAERAESVPSLMQPDTTPSKVQELTRYDASRFWPAAPEADQHNHTQKRAIPPRHGLPVCDGEQGAGQALAVCIVTLQITLAHLRRW